MCVLRFIHLLIPGKSSRIYRVLRVSGTVVRDSNNLQKVLFNNTDAVRIKSGKRSNMVVLPDRLYPDEESVPAGLDKLLEYGEQSNRFMPCKREGDDRLLDALSNSATKIGELRHFDTLVYPPFYIKSAEPSELKPRMRSTLIKQLKEDAEYDSGKGPTANFRKMYKKYSRDAADSQGNRYYPLAMVSGKGGIFADMDQTVSAFTIPVGALSAEDAGFKVNIKL